MQLPSRLCPLAFPPLNLIHHKYNINDRRTMLRPSLLLLVASASEPRPPLGQTAAHRRIPAAFTSVGGRLSGWGARLRCQSHEEEQGRSHHCLPVIGNVFIMNEIWRREHQRPQPGRGLHRNSPSSACMYVEIYVYCTVTLRVAG